jgi:hypothetical protein
MSGVGKTFWATQLASHGFMHADATSFKQVIRSETILI